MTDTLTGFALQHEAERQSAYKLIHEIGGASLWFYLGFDKLRGDVALVRAEYLNLAYWEIHRTL